MTCQTFEQYFVDYLEGTLSSELMRDAEAHLHQCRQCRAELAQQRNISAQIRRLTESQCPDRVLDSVLIRIEQDRQRFSWRTRFQAWCRAENALWKMGTTAAAAFLILAVAALFYQGGEIPSRQPLQYSAEEVEEARRDIELTLAYVNLYTQKTGHIVEQQLAAAHSAVTQPVQNTLRLQLRSTGKAVTQPLEENMLEPVNSLLHKYGGIL